MRCFHRFAATLCAASIVACAGALLFAAEPGTDEPKPSTVKLLPIHKTEAEWKKLLTPRQFQVTRRGTTEPAFANKYWHFKRAGEYRCVCCDLELFTSAKKFESDTGWPSFWNVVDHQHIKTALDDSDPDELRTEVLCARCQAHLGHVFADGPPPTGLRYCINSAALKFIELPKQRKD